MKKLIGLLLILCLVLLVGCNTSSKDDGGAKAESDCEAESSPLKTCMWDAEASKCVCVYE